MQQGSLNKAASLNKAVYPDVIRSNSLGATEELHS